MIDKNPNLYDCAHCKGTGICNHGKDGEACAACVKYHEINKKEKHYGLACGTCGGLGKAETLTHRMNNRATPVLAISIIPMCFVMILFFGLTNNQHFSEILVYCGTLSGGVIGHYFRNKNEK